MVHLDKFKKTEVISSIFSDYILRLEINDRKKNYKKPTSTWKLNNILLNNQWVTEEREKKKIKKTQMKQQRPSMIQNQWDSAKPLLKGKFMTQLTSGSKRNLKSPNLTNKT